MILVCGEALIDLFVTRGADGHPIVDARIGGSPLNLAVGLARLGEASGFFGGPATDPFGEMLRDFLRTEGVDLGFARISAAPRMQAIVGLSASGHASYSFPVLNGADRQITPADIPASLDAGVAAITFGCYPIIVPPVADAYLALARREAGRRVICLDPNIRLGMVADPQVWRQGIEAFLPLTDIVKASDEDIWACYGAGAPLADITRVWLGQGPSIVIITRGAAGAQAVLRDGRTFECSARAVEVVDTVGAGDAFFAALLSFLSRRGLLSRSAVDGIDSLAMAEALTDAYVAASIVCSRRGADLPTRADLAALQRIGAAA